MSVQPNKYATGLAGEFLVAGELLRRGVMAAVTYGNAKKADVVAINGNRAVRIEVKTTSQSKWVLGGEVPTATDLIWILVFLPVDTALPPEYYVLSAAEIRDFTLPRHLEYAEKFRLKHGREFKGKGVVSLHRDQVSAASGEWGKVIVAVGK